MARARSSRVRIPDPCVVVIFGASGDLTARKLMPALYDLRATGGLPEQFAVVGFARTDQSDDGFREKMREAIVARGDFDEAVWEKFAECLHYIPAGDHDEAAYRELDRDLKQLDAKHGTNGNRLY